MASSPPSVRRRCKDEHLQELFIHQFPIPVFLGGNSCLSHASVSLWGWQAVEGCRLFRLVLADARFVCPSWSCHQLCQNLDEKRADSAAGAGITWGITELSKCSWVSTVQLRVRCMEGKQSLDMLNIFGCSMMLSMFFYYFSFPLLFNWKKRAQQSFYHEFQQFFFQLHCVAANRNFLFSCYIKRMYINKRVP